MAYDESVVARDNSLRMTHLSDPRSLQDRIIFHDAIETVEYDLSNVTFESAAQVDAFYDAADQQLAATGRRWYFLVIYTDCVIGPDAWDRYAARGKHTNITFGLGTMRVGAS